jgi:RimJ/RimL family protein N-acetyltransferase
VRRDERSTPVPFNPVPFNPVPFNPVPITTRRLTLWPLRELDAAEMVVVLGDERLHEFIGGRPATPGELADRYRGLVAGSGRADELWLNWIVRLAAPDDGSEGAAIGTVQATVEAGGAGPTAAIAWVIGLPWQGNGYATEAARALVSWLAAWRPLTIIACVHREHLASQRVAGRAGLVPTDREVDGERVWELTPS